MRLNAMPGVASGSDDMPFDGPKDEFAQTTPISIDPGKSVAYVARDSMHVYCVAESEVVRVAFLLPPGQASSIRIPVGSDDGNSITRLSGPDIASHVLPQGGVPTPPTDYESEWSEALAGFVVCRNPPVKDRFEYGKRIVVSLREVDFGDGKLYSIKPTKLTVHAFPP